MDRTAIVRRRDDLFVARVGDETMMLNVRQGKYLALDAIGSRVWELIAAPTTIGDLLDTLTSEFDVDPSVCAAEALAFLGELVALDVVEVGH